MYNASMVGFNAVKALMNGERNKMVGIINKQIVLTPFEKAVKHTEELNKDLEELIEVLSS